MVLGLNIMVQLKQSNLFKRTLHLFVLVFRKMFQYSYQCI